MKTFWSVLFVIASFVAVFFLGRSTAPVQTMPGKTDTLYVWDSTRDATPEEKTRYVVRIDSIPYAITVVEKERDTVIRYVPVSIPIERVEYRADSYFAIVEGYKPSLAYIETYNKTAYITKVVKNNPRWGFGVHGGIGYNGKITPVISVGVQYTLITL